MNNENSQIEKNQNDIMKNMENLSEQNEWNDIGNQEIWKPIPSFEDRYLISSHGRIKSLYADVILKLKTNSRGYYVVGLWQKRKSKWFSLHKIVANNFIPNNNLIRNQINHKDGNKLNNKINNLEWCTAKENAFHSIQNGLNKTIAPGDDHQGAKLTTHEVKIIRRVFLDGEVSVKNLCDKYNLKELTIRRIIHNRTWKDSNYEQCKNQVQLILKKWDSLHKSKSRPRKYKEVLA